MRMGKATFYRTEKIDYAEQYDKKLSWDECKIVHRKLCKHYKLPIDLRYNGRLCGQANAYGVIKIGASGMNIGVLCHEVAHLLAYKKYRTMKHDKKTWRVMRGIMNYAKKKNYWSDELQRRSAVKIPKPEPSISELRLVKIDKRKSDIVRYEKRLAYYQKLYLNKIKKARRSILMLERYSLSF